MLQRIEWRQKSSRCVSRQRHSCCDSIFHDSQTIASFFFRQRILNQTIESNEKLRGQIKSAQDERKQLLKQIEESWWHWETYCFMQPLRHNKKRRQHRTVLALTSGIILTCCLWWKNVKLRHTRQPSHITRIRRYIMARGEVDKLGSVPVGWECGDNCDSSLRNSTEGALIRPLVWGRRMDVGDRMRSYILGCAILIVHIFCM